MNISDVINSYDTISLEEMGRVRLMNRIDSKYVTTIDRVVELLRLASDEFMIQQIDGELNMPYYTRYYDTEDVDMFYQHQRGKKTRQKVRVRVYEGGDTLPFLEIKSKNNRGRCNKKRVAMDSGTEPIGYSDFLRRHIGYKPDSLIPQIENHFYRITLVNKGMSERITIDTNLEFHNLLTDKRVSLDNIAIIEWKRDGLRGESRLGTLLRDLRIHPSGFSKYCVGMAVTNPTLKQNRLKAKLKKIDRLNTAN